MKENAGKTKYVILGLLAHSPQTGYSIKKSIEYEYSHFWQESFGQIYPTLKTLVNEGLAVCGDAAGDGRGQIVYSITEAGKAELICWLEEVPDVEKLRYEILLKVSFGSEALPDTVLGHLDAFISRNENYIKELNGFLDYFHAMETQGQAHTGNELTTLCGVYVYTAMRDWAKEAQNIIREKKEKANETENS